MRKLLPVLLYGVILLSCAKEMTSPAPEEFTLEVSMPSAVTRTSLGPKASGVYPVLWSSGDCIRVNGVLSRPLTALEAGGTTAVFRFPESIKAPYHVQYGEEVPAVQLYSEGNIRSGYAPMEATGSGISFTLSHRSCILSIPLSGNVSVAGVSLSSLDGTPLSGGGPVLMTMPSGGVDVAGGKTFCLAVKPGLQSKGVKVEICTATGARMIFIAFVGETLSEGSVYEFPSTAFAANAEPVTVIADYAALNAFAARVAAGEKYLEARLAADVTVDAAWVPLEAFAGDLDGGGYTVSGLRRAFANELRGCLRNLTVDGAVTISSKDDIVGDESIYWAGILANRIYSGGRVENCTVKGSITYNQWGSKNIVVGALCGYAPRGVAVHCVNEASVTAVGNGSAAIYAGGLFGRIYASTDVISVENCRNEGPVTVRGAVKGASIGGIVGHMDAVHTSTLTGDVNAGTILLDASSQVSAEVNMGGVAGYCKDMILSCSNEGLVHQAAATASVQNVGGVAGTVITESVDGCRNSGNLLLDAPSAAVVRCGGILGYAFHDDATTRIDMTSCMFGGEILVDIATHSTLYAKPFTGLYNITAHAETDCTSSGTVTVK